MALQKSFNLDHILFENVSFNNEVMDPVLVHVDLELPMDQTIIIQSSNPAHAVHLLEILAGRKEPQTGKVKWTDKGSFQEQDATPVLNEVVGSYFESNRPSPQINIQELLASSGASEEIILNAMEHFELADFSKKSFRELTFEVQKLVLLIKATLRTPQMLVLEDPAMGLTEQVFLNYLDWIQLWQRQGHLRHIYLTNHHPTAIRHLDAGVLYVEDGLVYFDETQGFKKVVHF